MIRPTLVASSLSVLLVPALHAGEIEPAFKRFLAGLPPRQHATAFVTMADAVDVHALVRHLDRMNATRQFRHELVVRSLQDKARTTQALVAPLLAELQRKGEVESVTPFWIFNGMAVRGTAAAFQRLAADPATGWIYSAGSDLPGAEDLIAPVFVGASPPLTQVAETGLLECKADFMWSQGFTGSNTVVCNIDTGVDANHPALRARWRGRVPGVPASAAWNDPIANTTTPAGRNDHGTHTMGTICGDDGLGNLIGMAPTALWIASNPIDAPGTRAQKNVWYNQGIQWTADPDGNPSTVRDVPDVCGNSWGVRDAANGVGPCSTVFHASLDAAEASTVIYAWASGNEGATGPRVPSDRIASATNTFTIGALNNDGSLTIAGFSSRGPSPCDMVTIKPEVSARGVNVRSALRGTGYGVMSGTSMATPHAAGALALLRDMWSEITVVRAKEILMLTADDLGTPGEDNNYGHGRINLQRAHAQILAERPAVAISVMGTRQVVREGQTLLPFLVLSSYSTQDELVEVSMELTLNGQGTGYFFVGPIPVLWPAGASNRDFPVPFPLGVPTGLPPELVGVPMGARGVVRRLGGAVVSQAEYAFQLSR